jgi:hypothetical protein
MKLQRYDLFTDYLGLDSCEIGCHVAWERDDTGDWVRASDVERLEKRLEKLERVLEQIRDSDCDCMVWSVAEEALTNVEE